jgi:hypothetical protein
MAIREDIFWAGVEGTGPGVDDIFEIWVLGGASFVLSFCLRDRQGKPAVSCISRCSTSWFAVKIRITMNRERLWIEIYLYPRIEIRIRIS